MTIAFLLAGLLTFATAQAHENYHENNNVRSNDSIKLPHDHTNFNEIKTNYVRKNLLYSNISTNVIDYVIYEENNTLISDMMILVKVRDQLMNMNLIIPNSMQGMFAFIQTNSTSQFDYYRTNDISDTIVKDITMGTKVLENVVLKQGNLPLKKSHLTFYQISNKTNMKVCLNENNIARSFVDINFEKDTNLIYFPYSFYLTEFSLNNLQIKIGNIVDQTLEINPKMSFSPINEEFVFPKIIANDLITALNVASDNTFECAKKNILSENIQIKMKEENNEFTLNLPIDFLYQEKNNTCVLLLSRNEKLLDRNNTILIPKRVLTKYCFVTLTSKKATFVENK